MQSGAATLAYQIMTDVSENAGQSSLDTHCDPARLKVLGEAVRRRLEANPAVESGRLYKADIYAMHGFLSARECERIVARMDERATPSTLYKGTEVADFRTSYTHHFDPCDALARNVKLRLADLLGIDPAHAEPLQGQRYGVGQQYRSHHDFFHVTSSYWTHEAVRGGQRSWTAMIFLNQPEEGGETDFPSLGFALRPRTGSLVIWNNMDRQGRPNTATIHAACPVKRGVKHVITQWFRLEPYRADASAPVG